MSAHRQVLVDADQFAAWSGSWPGDRTPLSPLDDASGGDAPGGATDDVRRAMDVLVAPVASVEVTDLDAGTPQTWGLYVSAAGEEVATVGDTEDGMIVCSASSVRAELTEILAASPVGDAVVPAVATELSTDAAWTLAVIVDLQRQSALVAAMEARSLDVDVPPSVVEPALITKALATLGRGENPSQALFALTDDPSWATAWILVASLPSPATPATVAASLDDLVAKGVLARRDGGLALVDDWTAVANRMLIPDGLAMLTTRHERPDQIDEDEVMGLAAGSAVLWIVVDADDADTVSLHGGPVARWNDLVKNAADEMRPVRALLRSSLAQQRAAGPPSVTANQQGRTPLPSDGVVATSGGSRIDVGCATCGAPAEVGAVFCRQCGARLVPTARFCEACHESSPPESNYCIACGSPFTLPE